jgi:ribosome-binding protein aMBF1 (putative translation factor)
LRLLTVTSQAHDTWSLSVDDFEKRGRHRNLDFAIRFGHNLARCRRRVGLSQEELAVRASLHRTAVGQIERGERVARTDTLVKLAGSLSIEPEQLLEGLEWTPGKMTLGELSVQADAKDRK